MTSPPTLALTLNGEPTTVPAPHGTLTVGALLDHLDLRGAHVAVAVDLTFVPRSAHDTFTLLAGAAVEIVAPMQGG